MELCLFARPHLAPDGDVDRYLEMAELADRAGVHAIVFGEHLVVGPRTDAYPYGSWMHTPETTWPDPIVVLAAVASRTRTLRLATGVVLAPLRAGLDLAKSVATLDVVSGGRVDLGVGIGWQREEFVATGQAWKERDRRFHEVIRLCRTAWGPQPFDVEIDGRRVEALTALPRPVQDRIPLLYGMRMHRGNADRVADLGDGWTPVGIEAAGLRRGVVELRSAFERRGRSPDELIVRVGMAPVYDDRGRLDVRATMASAPRLVEAGATQLQLSFLHRLESIDEAEDIVGAAMEDIRAVS